MFRNYLKTISRNFTRYKWYASLNLLGLTTGFTAFILISIYLHHQTSYESFHSKADRIFRPTWYNEVGQDFSVQWARIPFNFINEMPEYFPEIEHQIRFQNQDKKYLRIGQDKFTPKNAYVTDKEVFEVFDLKMLNGNPAQALAEPQKIVISSSIAQKYFANVNPIGESIYVTSPFSAEELIYEVTGVFEDLPSHTHLPIDILFSYRDESERRGWAYIYTLLKEGSSIEQIQEKSIDFLKANMEIEEGEEGNFGLRFQALPDIHLNSDLAREIKPNGNKTYVNIFFFVGIFILLIAYINFINLSSALSIGRSKEIGVRKILGASKRHNMIYAFLESCFYSFLALAIACVLAWLIYPTFTEISGAELTIAPWKLLLYLLLIALLGGLLSGFYPAIVLNAISLQNNLKAGTKVQTSNFSFNTKRALISIQFCAAIILIGGALVGYRQVQYLNNKQLGFKQDQILAIPSVPDVVTGGYRGFKNQVQAIPGVQKVAACMQVPSEEIRDSGPTYIKGETENMDNAPMLDMQVIDGDFIDMMEIEFVAGQVAAHEFILKEIPEFSEENTFPDYISGQSRTYLINETAMKKLGWDDPQEAIGKEIRWSIGGLDLAYGPVTGVVKDFHQESLKNQIDPLILVFDPIWLRTFLVEIPEEESSRIVPQIASIWEQNFPTYPFEYQFLDEMFDKLYKTERSQVQLLSWFSLLAIFIASLGLFAMTAFNLRTRMKEIAIRKVLGANLKELVQLLAKDYLWVILLSAIIAIPISYYGLSSWLDNFAYRINISVLPYLITIVLIVLVLGLIIGLQTFVNTRHNPSEYLNQE